MSVRTVITAILLAMGSLSYAQTPEELEELYRDANSYFFFQDYEEALALYLRIHPHFPNNYNIEFRIGFCYLNIPGSKHRAIPFLERAAANTTRRFSEQSLRETLAPHDAIFYLGNAYFINNQLDQAERAYQRFFEAIQGDRGYDMEYYNKQVRSLRSSRIIQSFPVNFIRSNLGSPINDRFSNYNAVISGDGSTLAYTSRRRFYQAVYVARREGNAWGTPRNITLDLMVDGNTHTLSLSHTGHELYLFREVNQDGNIYVTRFVDGRWTPMQPLNPNINSRFYETHASLSPDGSRLYFASNRAGGFGDLDIYVSQRDAQGEWGRAVNLGPTINTRFNENTPFLAADGKTLFFSSEGHNTMGEYDVFLSNLQPDGTWSPPINLGYPLNTTDDNLFYFPIGEGSMGLFSMFDPQGQGEQDIVQVEIFLPRYQRGIITSSELHARTVELPSILLVVDTLNPQGVALLDPSRPDHVRFLDPERNFKLFFDGRSYSLRDHHQFVRSLLPVAAEREREISSLGLPVHHQPFSSYIQPPTLDDSLARTAANLDLPIAANATPPGDTPGVGAEADPLALTDPQADVFRQMRSILMALADSDLRVHLESILSRFGQHAPAPLTLQAKQMARTADSLGLSRELIGVFAELLDIISGYGTGAQARHARQLAHTSSDVEFFSWYQRVKRLASPPLAQLLDRALLNDPSIASFMALWQQLTGHMAAEIKPHLSELLYLLTLQGYEGFLALPDSVRQAILMQATAAPPHLTWAIGGITSIGLLLALAALYYVYRRRKARRA